MRGLPAFLFYKECRKERNIAVEDPLSCSRMALHDIPLGYAPEGDCELFFFIKNVVRSAMLWTGTDEKENESIPSPSWGRGTACGG